MSASDALDSEATPLVTNAATCPMRGGKAGLYDDAPITINDTAADAGGPQPPAADASAKQQPFSYRPALSLLGFVCLESIVLSVVQPIGPFAMQSYFGNDRAVSIQTLSDAGRAFITLLLCPFVGIILDTVGRRPFFLFNAAATVLPGLALLLWPAYPIPYLIGHEIRKTVGSAYQLAYITDHYQGAHRAMVFAVVNGLGTMAAFAGFSLMALSTQQLLLVGLVVAVARIPYVAVLIPESFTQRKPLSREQLVRAPAEGLRIIRSSSVLTAIVGVTAGTSLVTSTTDIWGYYFIDKLGWNVSDNMMYVVEIMMMFPVGILVLYPLLSKVLSPARLCAFGYKCCMSLMIMIMWVSAGWMVYGIVVPLVAGVCASIPAVIGLFANSGRGPASESQGQRMAGLSAVMDLVSAVGPLVFGQMYSQLPKAYKQAPFAMCAVIAMAGLTFCIVWLPRLIRREQSERAVETLALPTDSRGELPFYDVHDVKAHASPEHRLWVTYRGGVHDLTDFLADCPPCGAQRLIEAGGRDVSVFWDDYRVQQRHEASEAVLTLLDAFKVGQLMPKDASVMETKFPFTALDSDDDEGARLHEAAYHRIAV
jgi:MFS family permease